MFLEISQYSQENTCVRVSFLIKLQAEGYFYNLDPDHGSWTLDLEPDPKNLDSEKPGP